MATENNDIKQIRTRFEKLAWTLAELISMHLPDEPEDFEWREMVKLKQFGCSGLCLCVAQQLGCTSSEY